jgi:hypothetical protein
MTSGIFDTMTLNLGEVCIESSVDLRRPPCKINIRSQPRPHRELVEPKRYLHTAERSASALVRDRAWTPRGAAAVAYSRIDTRWHDCIEPVLRVAFVVFGDLIAKEHAQRRRRRLGQVFISQVPHEEGPRLYVPKSPYGR